MRRILPSLTISTTVAGTAPAVVSDRITAILAAPLCAEHDPGYLDPETDFTRNRPAFLARLIQQMTGTNQEVLP
ncbi:MAG: hypothetical protein P8Z78_02000 [Gammaproteobacteria bacterium]|jgi:hypothetical protein